MPGKGISRGVGSYLPEAHRALMRETKGRAEQALDEEAAKLWKNGNKY